MYHDEAVKQLCRAVRLIKWSCFGMAYCFEWNVKTKHVIRLANGPKYLNFQILCNLLMSLVAPIFLAGSYFLAVSPTHETPASTLVITFVGTLVLMAFVPMAWNLGRLSGPKKYVHVYEATLKLERHFEGKTI